MSSSSFSDLYKNAGVDITAGYESVQLIKDHVKRTNTPGVIGGVGGFGGLFAPDLSGVSEPILVSGTDGVGTKLKLAFMLDKHDTVGIDCVAMCVNDIVCSGAKPLFFLDYIAVGKNTPKKIADIVGGVAEGCVQAGCALVGGETAEMPGFYPEDEYDLAGFSVGMVDRKKVIDKANVKSGDALIALPSSGVHSNGFSLVRKILRDSRADLNEKPAEFGGKTLGETLLTPTKIYVKAILGLLEKVNIKSVAHITGGGFYENIPRCLPDGISVKIKKDAVKTLPVFDWLAKAGNIPTRELYNVFNMGVGMSVVVDSADADTAVKTLRSLGEEAYILGETVASDEGVIIC